MMNCEQCQEAILLSDDPKTALVGDSEIAQHVAGCAVCQAFAQRLARLETTAGRLPLPGNSEVARGAVLVKIREQVARRRRFFLGGERPFGHAAKRWVGAVAAVLVVGIGVTIWMHGARRTTEQPSQASPVVMDQLIDWDLALADAEAPQERQDLYASQAASLNAAVQQASLTEEDRRFATTLLENGAWLSRNHDPVERTEKFCDLADLLVGRMDRAAAANDEQTVQRLGKHYGRVQKGIGANLARLDANAFVAPPGNAVKRAERLERIAKRQEEAQRRLAVLAERSPKAAQKALRRMLENPKKAAAARRAAE
ncbi:MAG: hypothetical protein JWN40_56 [Phycisphaerales bacterium]|nr:hypothetical protein [Phycisphaerales bacterium]